MIEDLSRVIFISLCGEAVTLFMGFIFVALKPVRLIFVRAAGWSRSSGTGTCSPIR